MAIAHNTAKAKKLVVAFDPAKPDQASSDFLVPVVEEARVVFFGTRSRKIVRHGMVVFVGQEVTVSDVFARLVDSGRRVPSVAESLALIANYLNDINAKSIGQVVQIVENARSPSCVLEVVQIARPSRKRPLP